MDTMCVTCSALASVDDVQDICVCSVCKTEHWIDTKKGEYFRISDGAMGVRVEALI